ncbi:MAG: organic hydroperoxide resistance protein [Solirubrobacteraceae bacterium]|nr:MAG: organic hydroperoxide resistance protein [Solirubrobacterales bacterium]
MKILYTAEATATGGRAGHARTTDGKLDVELEAPTEMGGSGEGTNPEQLFAAGYGACFQSAMAVIGRRMDVDVSDSTVTTKVGIGPNENRGFSLEVVLEVAIPGVDRALAEELVAKAHEVCPYSNATRGNIPVELAVV